MTTVLKYVLLLSAIGFFVHSLWLYWFAYSTGSPVGEAVGPYHRAADSVACAAFALVFVVILKQHEELKRARSGNYRSE